MSHFHLCLVTLFVPSVGSVSVAVVADGWLAFLEAEGRGAWKGAKGTPILFSLFALLPAKSEFNE